MRGNVVSYSYIPKNNIYYVSEINYGGNNAIGNYARLTFDYEERNDATTIFVAGLSIRQDRRLKEIKSYFNEQLLRTYTPTYADSTSSLLRQLDCYANGKSLNPLRFYYGENNRPEGFEKGSILLASYFNNNYALNLSKGKFTLNSPSDGLIEYPSKSTYGIVATKKNGLG